LPDIKLCALDEGVAEMTAAAPQLWTGCGGAEGGRNYALHEKNKGTQYNILQLVHNYRARAG